MPNPLLHCSVQSQAGNRPSQALFLTNSLFMPDLLVSVAAMPVCARHSPRSSATSRVCRPLKAGSCAAPGHAAQVLSGFVFLEHLLRKEKSIFPKHMFYFAISLLDLNL